MQLKWLTGIVLAVLIVIRGEALGQFILLNLTSVTLVPRIVIAANSLRWNCLTPNSGIHLGESSPILGDAFAPNALMAGREAAVNGDCVSAAKWWQIAVERARYQQRWAHFELARGLFSLGQREAAIMQFRLSGAGHYIHELASTKQRANQLLEARDLFELAYAVQPNLEAAQSLALVYSEENQTDRAAQVWQQLADATSDTTTEHWVALSEEAVLRQDWLGARTALGQALKVTADPYSIDLRLGRVLMKQGAWNEALLAFSRAVELKPASSSEPYTSAGNIEAKLGHYQAAMAWYDKAFQVLPDDPWLNIGAGNAARQFNDLSEAERRYRLAVDSHPNHFVALYTLGMFLHDQQRFAEAIPYLERAANNGDCAILDTLAEDYAMVGNNDRASQIASRRINCVP